MKSAHIQNPILIIDQDGLIGEPLSVKLAKEFPVVFVSRSPLANVEFVKKIPAIPDNKYSQIIFIDERGRGLEILPKIIKKVRDINAGFIFAQGLSLKGEYAVNRVLRLYPSAKTVIFGDIFDKQLVLSKENTMSVINKFISQAQRFGKMQVLGDGLGETYSVFLSDVVDGLTDLVFGMHRTQSFFYLFPKPAVPEISLAHMLQKINPEIKVDFVRGDSKLGRTTFPLNGKNLLGDKYPLAKRIREIDIKKKALRQPADAGKAKTFPFFIQHRFGAGLITWVLIFLFFSPFIFTLFFSLLGLSTLYYAQQAIDKGNLSIAKNSFHLSQTFFYLGKQTVNILSSEAKIIRQEKKIQRLSEDIVLGRDMSAGLAQALDFGVYFSAILSGKSKDPRGDFTKARSAFKHFVLVLDKLRAEGKIPLSILQSLENIKPLIKLLSSTLETMPSMLGMEGEKAYLILFQDNMELRPGGGVINSYGVLKFNQGKITQFTLSDVGDADKQLKGHVEPPFGLKRYLPEKHWQLKDSNFDVDFVEGAQSAINFFFVETGQKTSGAIGIDAAFLKNILQAIGPVYLADYQETVDENNLYALMQKYAEQNISPSSLQKKAFFKSLHAAMMTKITGKKAAYLLIVRAISDSLAQKHLLLTLNDFQNIFTINGWSSSLWDGRGENKETINDFIGISEANLGFNKVNHLIKRQISQNVILEDKENILEELTISYKNESKASSGADYKNYLRIILPKDTVLSEISINSLEQKIVEAITDPLIYEAKNFKPLQGLEVEKVNKDNKTIFGFFVKIPAGEIVKLKLKYILDKKIFGLNSFAYNLKIFKQPGTDSLPYSFSIVYPDDLKLIKSSDRVSGKEKMASYSEKILEDKSIMINFAK